jgi:hypothetical protein
MRKILLIPLCASAAFSIAANDPAKFFHTVPHRTPDASTKVDPTFHPSSGDPKQDINAMATNGFEPIGYSSFNGREAGEKNVAKQARAIGATDVVYIEKYTDTQSAGAIANTSYSRWGAFGFVTPMSVRRYDQMAIYFRQAPRRGLGTFMRELTDDEKNQVGSNKGLEVSAVVKGSPAFMSDILPGDILLEIAERPVWDLMSFHSVVDVQRGKTIPVIIYRAGQRLTKSVSIPTGDW